MIKHIPLALLAALCAAPLAAHADQRLKKSEVPAPVLDAVAKKYGDAKQTGYQKEVEDGKTQYEVKLTQGKNRLEVSLTPEGKVVSEETQVSFSQVPAPVRAGFAASKYGKWKVRKAEKIVEGEDAAKVTYEIAVQHGTKGAEAVFDAGGKLLKEETFKAHKGSGEGE